MEGPISNGKTKDEFHTQIVNAINFTKTKACSASEARLKVLGFSKEDSAKLLGGSSEGRSSKG